MAQSLEEWKSTHVAEFNSIPEHQIYNRLFFRDEQRAIVQSETKFLSPADGIIINQKETTLDKPVMDIKGKKYSIRDSLGHDKDAIKYLETHGNSALVIDIFMSFYDVHLNRVPYAGFLKYKQLDTIETFNMPMLAVEEGIFEGKFKKAVKETDYMFNNQRMLNTIYSPDLDYTYFVVQIADEEVNVITPFNTRQNTYYRQGDRFSFIRWGSQNSLILPKMEGYNFKTLVETGWHVKAGTDALVQIEKI